MVDLKKRPKEVSIHPEENPVSDEPCPRCAGTGLICGHEPVISPGSCCADYANALCPDCKGTGKKSTR